MRKISRLFCVALLCVTLTIACAVNTSALKADDLSEGTYRVDSSLSCYVNAMGGVEFGAPLLVSVQIDVDSKQNKTMTLNFTKSSVTIYNITCDTFIDPDPSSEESDGDVKNGTIGFYDDNGTLQTSSVTYTLSEDTALNSKSEEVHYVETMTFPIESIKDTYELTLFINSNVMGVQFGGGGSSSYSATLTVDWNSIKSGSADTRQEEEYETLPDETKDVQTTTEVVVEEKSEENVVEKDGLNIHYANGDDEESDDSESRYKAYLNMTMVWILIFVAVAIIIAGVIFLASCKFKRKREKK